jgi:hypothetical protein
MQRPLQSQGREGRRSVEECWPDPSWRFAGFQRDTANLPDNRLTSLRFKPLLGWSR